MQRSMWQGGLTLGATNIQTKMFTGERPRSSYMKTVTKGCLQSRKTTSSCSCGCGETETVKLYEMPDGSYAEFAADPTRQVERSESIALDGFVDADTVDWTYVSKTYHLVPGTGAGEAFAAVREAMIRTKQVGVAKVALRDGESDVIVAPSDNGLLEVFVMKYADDRVELGSTPKAVRPSDTAVADAMKWVESRMLGEWVPQKDTRRELIEASAEDAPKHFFEEKITRATRSSGARKENKKVLPLDLYALLGAGEEAKV